MSVELRLVYLLLLAPRIAWGQPVAIDGEWAWFRAASSFSSWFLTGGKGQIASSGNTFRGQLFDDKDANLVRHEVTGSISGTLINARIAVSADHRLNGQLRRVCYSQGGGRETILLSDGVNVVGLSRELGKDAACKPTP